MLSVCLFVKILNGVETTHILSTYGLTHEGRVILRSVLEGFFFLKATVSDAAFVDEYILADEINRLKLMKAAKNHNRPPFLELKKYATDEVIKALDRKIQKQGIKELNVWNVAQKLKLQYIYDSLYRLFSTDIHTGVRSLEQYMETGATGDLRHFDWRPHTEDVEQNISMGIDTLLRSLDALDDLFGMNIKDETHKYLKELEKAQDEYEKRAST